MSDRLVLLAIAHRVSNDNGEAFPSITRIVKETLLSERQVYDSIKVLVEIGEVEVLEEKSQYGTNRYRLPLCLEWLNTLHPAQNAGVHATQRKEAKGVQDIQKTPAQNADEPSLEPSVEENNQEVHLAFPKPIKKEKQRKGLQFSTRERAAYTPPRKPPTHWNDWFAPLFKRYTDKIAASNPATWDAMEEMLCEIGKEEAEARLSAWTTDRGTRLNGWAAKDFLAGEWRLVTPEPKEADAVTRVAGPRGVREELMR